MPWQRRIVEHPKVEDLTDLEPDTEMVWESRTIIICPNCGRTGAGFANGVAHSVTEDRRIMEACVSDAPEGSPKTVLYDMVGNVMGSWDGPTEPEKQN